MRGCAGAGIARGRDPQGVGTAQQGGQVELARPLLPSRQRTCVVAGDEMRTVTTTTLDTGRRRVGHGRWWWCRCELCRRRVQQHQYLVNVCARMGLPTSVVVNRVQDDMSEAGVETIAVGASWLAACLCAHQPVPGLCGIVCVVGPWRRDSGLVSMRCSTDCSFHFHPVRFQVCGCCSDFTRAPGTCSPLQPCSQEPQARSPAGRGTSTRGWQQSSVG